MRTALSFAEVQERFKRWPAIRSLGGSAGHLFDKFRKMRRTAPG
jgi:hypothetical protein